MSMAAYLDVVAAHLHPPLVSREAWRDVRAIGARLPATSKSILECRLQNDNSRVDFSIHLPRFVPELPASLTGPLWEHFRPISRLWSESGTPLHRLVRDMWLEFDAADSRTHPQPNLFFGLAQGAPPASDLDALTGILTGADRPAAAVSGLQHVVDEWSDSRLVHLGAMLARRSEVIRLVIGEVPGNDLQGYLERAGWSDSSGGLNALVRMLSAFAGEFYLDVDVGETLQPRVAVEAFVRKDSLRSASWAPLVEHLVNTGLCAPDKGEALLAWPGITQRSENPDAWPENLRWTDSLIGLAAASLFVREISHIKLVYEPGRIIEAKAYLRIRHAWINREALTGAGQEKKNV